MASEQQAVCTVDHNLSYML